MIKVDVLLREAALMLTYHGKISDSVHMIKHDHFQEINYGI